MSDRPESDARALVAGQYIVDVTKSLPDAGGGIPAFAATSRRGGSIPLMALRVDRRAPARPRPLASLVAGLEGLLTPLAQGIGPPIDGHPAWYVICQAPFAPPVSAGLRPWPEPVLIDLVLRPIAAILEQLQARGLTHRGIRPNNVFHGQPNRHILLGPAWAAPPAMHQPVVFETPYSALCHPAARGEGRITDDVYALGILLVTLALGRVPLEGMDDQAIIYRKLEIGDFAAITSGERLPPMLTDLVRGMLAEDPEHRPTPGLLRDPVGARGRRVAARPISRAQRPLKIGALMVWNTRTLAMAMAVDPADGLIAIQGGTLMYWLRRGLGDSSLAVKLEELVRQHAMDVATDKETAQATLLMRAIEDADIFMPLCWRGLAIYPDGLGSALAAFQENEPDQHRKLLEIVLSEAQGVWAVMREERSPAAPHRMEARQRRAILQIRGPAGGLPRLGYTLNPLTPCASPLLGERWIVTVSDLVLALDAIAVATPDAELLERHIAAFIGARSERWLDEEVQAFGNDDEDTRTLTTLRLFSAMQSRYHPEPLTGLTAWVATRAQPLVERWKNRERRTAVEEQLKKLAAQGFLAPMLALLRDRTGHEADSEGLRVAVADLTRLEAALLYIRDGSEDRATIAARLGQEIAAGIGLAAVAATLIMTALR